MTKTFKMHLKEAEDAKSPISGTDGSAAFADKYVKPDSYNPHKRYGETSHGDSGVTEDIQTFFKLTSDRAKSILQSLWEKDKLPSLAHHNDVTSADSKDIKLIKNELIRMGCGDDFQEVVEETKPNFLKELEKILAEGKTLTQGQQSALVNFDEYPSLGGSHYYYQYRFGLAMASSPYPEYKTEPEAAGADNFLTLAYSKADQEKIDHAKRRLGIKSRPLSNGKSKEHPYVNTKSPMTPKPPVKRKS